MKIDEYISGLRSKNIIISVQDERIAVKASDEVITPEIIEELTAKKQEILLFFESIKKEKNFISIPEAAASDDYPLSSAQRRMYFLQEFDKESTAYNMPIFLKIKGDLEVSRLERAFRQLVVRHQSLSTIFEMQEGEPVQRILDASGFEIVYRQSELSEVDTYIEEFIRPFDLTSEFPIRVSLMDIKGEDYLLLIDIHHIINDGVSFGVLMHDFWKLYDVEELSELRIQYVDYAVWQQSDAHRALVATHKEYWLDRYSEELTSLELPTDYPRPLERNNRGGVHSICLDKSQSAKLREIAGKEGVTMYTLFFAIYNILLGKLCNQEDIVVGTPTSGRHHKDLEGLVGMFVNTLALRTRVDSDIDFKDFLNNLQRDTLTAFDHQLYQYEELVEALDLPRDGGRNPLFDIFFSYNEQIKDLNLSATDLKVSIHDMPQTVAKFDLSLSVMESETINLFFTYRKDLFKASTMVRFSEYLERIIEEVVKDTSQSLGDIEILSLQERERLLVEFNDTATDYDLERTVLDMFIAQSATTPDALALVFGEECLTYTQLDVRSDLWASHLIGSGVVPGSIVGLMMTRSTEMITAILAVMKAGAAYLPLNLDQPISRTCQALEECKVEVIVCNIPTGLESISGYTLLEARALDEVMDLGQELPCISPSDLAYIIYTSGSTGQPKGVLVRHEGVSNLIQHERDFFGIDSTDKILQFSRYYFDASVEQTWLALTTGATLVLIEEEKLLSSNTFNSYLEEKGVTHLHSTPSFLEGVDFEGLVSLCRVISAGEVCKPLLAKKVLNNHTFYNKYGPTETTVSSTIQEVVKVHALKHKIPIGRPIANTQAYILNDNLNLLPQGVIGELYLGGKGLAKGYLNRSDLTQECFIDNPFGGGKVYRTGDLARWLADGTIEFSGRLDGQIKLNGVRIELGEIESHLNTFEGIKASVVSLREIENNKSLVAYYIAEGKIPESKLKGHLIDRLPFSMLPTFFVQLDEFLLSPTGKLDRRLLPDPVRKERVYVAPSNETEEQLVLIWSEILQIGIKKINVDDGFFELGGNSLKAISVVNAIYKTLSVKITLKEVFTKQTIREIADYIITVKQIKGIKAENKEEIKLVL
jgi:amino acid adenylation domain-containing protein